MSDVLATVFYHSFATSDVYEIIRQAAGTEFKVLTLDADDELERFSKIAQCDAIICAATPLHKQHLDAAVNLKLVHHQGVGWQDTMDWPEIKRRRLPLALTPEGTTIGVAEHTIMLMLAAAKRLSYADSELRKGRWHVNALRAVSRQLFGKTVGYIGMGRIAQAVAERLTVFGCAGIYVDPAETLSTAEAVSLGVRRGSLGDVLAASDILTIHVPLTDGTRHMIGVSALAKLKPGAIIINTARGGIIDEHALAAELKSGHVLSAGIDVFENEPAIADNPLFELDNVIITPHISAGTSDAMHQKMESLFGNLKTFFTGGELRNRVTFP